MEHMKYPTEHDPAEDKNSQIVIQHTNYLVCTTYTGGKVMKALQSLTSK